MLKNKINVWFPTVRAKSGSDVYTTRLCAALKKRGVNCEITWFSQLHEFIPFFMGIKSPPKNTNIIHTTSWNAFAFQSKKTPLVCTLHHNVFDPELSAYKSILQSVYHNYLIRDFETKSLKKSSINIAVSQYTANSYEKTFNINNTKVIHNWLDTDAFKPPQIRIKNKTFKLLFIGNFSRRKGADLLPKIMSRLGKGYELHTTGGIRDKTALNQKVLSIINHGHIPETHDLISLYQSCDALIFPSRLEGFGLAALEAQACGLPVIATNSSAFPEVVIDGVTGSLCPKDDVNAFVSAIYNLKNQPETIASMQVQARQHVLTNFTEHKIISEYISLYKTLL
ncbi:MAG: group 1 glycosyl transferase [Piscirickettsiaceae bacterium]|nr:MAG: group 1 glycosyl transferase [Piscirickettsiaceae bacterium]